MKAARPPGLSTAKDRCATSPPTVSKYGVAIGNSLREVTSIVVDDVIRPERPHIGMVCRTRGRDHAGADMLGKLDGKAGDTPRPALDQDGLAALELQRILDRTQGREAGESQRGSVVMG